MGESSLGSGCSGARVEATLSVLSLLLPSTRLREAPRPLKITCVVGAPWAGGRARAVKPPELLPSVMGLATGGSGGGWGEGYGCGTPPGVSALSPRILSPRREPPHLPWPQRPQAGPPGLPPAGCGRSYTPNPRAQPSVTTHNRQAQAQDTPLNQTPTTLQPSPQPLSCGDPGGRTLPALSQVERAGVVEASGLRRAHRGAGFLGEYHWHIPAGRLARTVTHWAAVSFESTLTA